MSEAEVKQAEYAAGRRLSAIKMGVDKSLHGLTHVCQFSHSSFTGDDPRWKAVNDQAHRALAELLVLQTNLELIVGRLEKEVDE